MYRTPKQAKQTSGLGANECKKTNKTIFRNEQKKNIKTIGNITKRITMFKKIAITNPEDKKKENSTSIDYLNRASCTGKNLQKNNKMQK